MKEYIEREAFIKMLAEQIKVEWNQGTSPVSWAHAFSEFIDMLEDFPAADVVERVRGEWREWHGDKMVGEDEYRHYHYNTCSVCHKGNAVKSNFCPNCGCQMVDEVKK